MSGDSGGRRARPRLALVLSVLLVGVGAYLVVGQVLAARTTSSLPSATGAPAKTPANTTRGGAASESPVDGTTGGTVPVSPAPGAPPTSGVAVGQAPLAPNGTYTTEAGTTATIASLRGEAVLVWFVAGGCASCAASIPAVSSHLAQIRATGVRVLTLGLFEDFPSGGKGMASVLAFGRSAAGRNVERAGWSWGMASRQLSMAYDPFGVPDVYVLIGPHGTLRYRNSVPVSTMSQLLAAARRVGRRPTLATEAAASVPCC